MKICLLTCGGTIGMTQDAASGSLVPGNLHQRILELVPELKQYATIDTVFVCDLDSTNIYSPQWLEMAQAIADRYDRYDGFVVTHGTDTMSYSASMLSFLLQNLSKPVIFTGSQKPLTLDQLGHARNNLIHAVQFATMDLAEVALCFGTQLLRGNRSLKFSLKDAEAFRSFNVKPLGYTDPKPVLADHRTPRGARNFRHYPEIEDKVFLLKFFPGMRPETLSRIVDAGYRGVVIEAVGAGNLPTTPNYPKYIRYCSEHGVPVVVSTQCSVGKAEMSVYEVGKINEDAGAISAYDMTPVAAFTKLSWVLQQTKDLERIAQLMLKNVAGEISAEEK